MMCRSPYVTNGRAFGCGQCMPCRVNKRRIWSHRIMLEGKLWPFNTMATLTYEDEKVPRLEDGRGILNLKHIQDWLKRIRKAYEPSRLRYFACGEYGEQTWRPHYHVMLFNYPNCVYGQSRYSNITRNCCPACDLVRDTWTFGNVMLCELNDSTSSYIAGYVTKKMTHPDDPRLKGLVPEFARMSLKPGIGADFMHEVASTLMEFNLDEKLVDVPSTLRHANRVMPLGRYLTRKLRTYVGKDEKAPDEVLRQISEELQPLREAAFENSRSFKKEIIAAADQAVLNMEARQRIFKQRKDKL